MWDLEPGTLAAAGAGVVGLPARRTAPVRLVVRTAEAAEHATSVLHPGTEEEILEAVLAARDAGLTVRAVGACGSKNACFRTGGLALRLDRYARVLSISGRRVEAEAGVTVAALNEQLRPHGLTLPTQGEWLGATVAGAVATGVHGGGRTHGILPTSVAAIRLVTADGQVVTATRGDDLFRHAAVSLGLLGVTSTITFDCVPAFHLELVSRVVPFDAYIREHEAANRDHEFYSAIWIPTAGKVVTFAANRTRPPARTVPRRQRYSFTGLVLSAASRALDVDAISDRWFGHRAVDWADRVLTPIGGGSRHVRVLRGLTRSWREAEFAVPLGRAGDALQALDALLARHRHALRIPVGLRSSAADDLTLSPCAGRPSFWIALFFRDGNGFADEVRDLFERLDARSHWGKHVEMSPAHLRRQYPGWSAFRAARSRLDPDGTFTNAFSRRFGL